MDKFDEVRKFLESETLAHFISEHHHDLEVLRKGKDTIGDAMKVGACSNCSVWGSTA
jgi:hypothetical protein